MIDLNRLAKPDKTIREHTDDLITSLNTLNKLGYANGRICDIVKRCCEYHDYGKINDEFQKRVKSDHHEFFDNNKEVAHNVLSLCFIEEEKFNCQDDFHKACYAILNHHHNTDNFREIDDKSLLIDKFIEQFGGKKINRSLKNKLIKIKTDPEAQLIKGLLHKCDYAASGDYQIEYPNDFLKCSLDNFIKSLNSDWNELQNFCSENTNQNIIVIANTGMGKTEAGLLWIGDNKGFFILPLRTAINAIFDRVRNQIVKENIEQRVSLLHSETLSYYLKEAVTEEDKVLEYTKKGKQLNMPLTISTLDQLFNFVYKYHGFELKLATLSYSKIVIDEIQAYSPDLLAYLVSGLEMITQLGGKFAILTATLPPFVKDYIEEKIGQVKFGKFVKGIDRHNLKVIQTEIDHEFIYDHYRLNGGKVLIVCNTVKKAQEIFDLLKDEKQCENISLLHSKFIKMDRSEKEDQILAFGKTEFVSNGIWIATSIVEASLDIDFDYLFTELNDLNGLLQRLGRVNRKGLKTEMLNKPNAFVFTEINKSLLISPDQKRGFIDSKIHQLSKDALICENIDGVLSEEKKSELIEKYLTTDKIANSNFAIHYRNVKKYINDLYVGEKEIEEVQKMFRNITAYDVIPETIYDQHKEEIESNQAIILKIISYDTSLSKEENAEIKAKSKIAKAKARQAIYNYTVSVGLYDFNKSSKTLDLDFEKIPVVKCDYSFEKGFIRLKIEKQEEVFDNFL